MRSILNVLLIVSGFCIFHGVTSFYGIITATSFLISIGLTSLFLIVNGVYFLIKGEKELAKKQKVGSV